MAAAKAATPQATALPVGSLQPADTDTWVRLDAIADAAGLTTGAIYSIFGSKSELLAPLNRALVP